jgi:DNA (cytosine-5)-methyltransferase 1
VTRATCVEICAGAGGQALGLADAGFDHVAAVEIEPDACATLSLNRPKWDVLQADIRELNGRDFRGIDLLAGGVPCPPFSVAGHQLGAADERDLFPDALRLIREAKPAAVLLENVRGLASKRFGDYRAAVISELQEAGYHADWRLVSAADFHVPQLRPRFILIAMKARTLRRFEWPTSQGDAPTVGDALGDLMARDGWPGAALWAENADKIAPTLVGGSRKHGGPDLGPTRARRDWERLGVDGRGIANELPGPDDPLDVLPRLTLRMAARIQGFPDSWQFFGRKTSVYRQIGNAFPPPVAAALGTSILSALHSTTPKARVKVADRPASLELVS